MQSAVLAMIDFVRLSVIVRYHVKITPATIKRSSLEDSPMTGFLAEFSQGLLHRRRRTGVELLKCVNIHLIA